MAYQATPHILIVDDDKSICKSFSAILQTEGYQTTTANTAEEAIEKIEAKFFNIILLDIKLPDMEGTQLLAQLQEITPETIKIVITGYASIQNTVKALNFGADSYILKPIDPIELKKTIRNKLEAKQQADKVTKEGLAEWIQSQTLKTQSSGFQDFLEETASELEKFGLTRTEAKTYITITALGVASASQISDLSKIRREQVYRIIPKLEKHGIITRKLEKPLRFSATQPKKTIQHLIKTRFETIKEEIAKLEQRQANLISKLETIKLPIHPKKCSTEVIPEQQKLDRLCSRFIKMAQNAEQQIDIIFPLETLKYSYLNCQKGFKEKLTKKIRIRIITERHEPDAFTEEIIQFSETSNGQIKLKQVERLPFNLLVVDQDEAIWGKFQHKNENRQNLWTNDPTQISILKTSFESLWKQSKNIRKLNDRKKPHPIP